MTAEKHFPTPFHLFDQTNGVMPPEREPDKRELNQVDHAARNGITAAAFMAGSHS